MFAAALFTVYLRLSRTSPENSDQANILLAASDMLHGNLLLHGWYLTDVSFYTTEVPQYALLEIFFGVHANTAHIAAAMTYTLAVVLAVLVARGGFTSRAAVIRMLIAAGIMLAPQLGVGVAALLLSVGHIGTSVPVLLIFLLLDRAPQRWYVPVLTALGLAWVLIADELVLIIGVVPLALVCALRVAEAAVRERGLSRGLAARRYELSLIGAAGAAAGLAWVAERVLRALGGYILHPIRFTFASHYSWATLHVLWAVPRIFGADYRGLAGGPYYTALLHWVSLALVGLALLLVAWRFFAGAALVDQVLAVAIVLNIVLFVTTGAGSQGPHEIAVVAPFGAALAARMLAGPQASRTRAAQRAGPPDAGRRVRRLAWLFCSATWGVSRMTWSSPPRRRTARRSRPGCKPITCGTAWAATGRAASSRSTPTARSRSGRWWEEHHGAVPVAGQALVVRPGRSAGQLRRAGQHAQLLVLGAARRHSEVLRPSSARVPRRPLHRHGVGQEPAVQHSALTPRLPQPGKKQEITWRDGVT